MIFFNKNALKNKFQHYKRQCTEIFDKKRKKEENKKVDEASWESMDASDPPAHISKSPEDRISHQRHS
jgi:hypothetical protein